MKSVGLLRSSLLEGIRVGGRHRLDVKDRVDNSKTEKASKRCLAYRFGRIRNCVGQVSTERNR